MARHSRRSGRNWLTSFGFSLIVHLLFAGLVLAGGWMGWDYLTKSESNGPSSSKPAGPPRPTAERMTEADSALSQPADDVRDDQVRRWLTDAADRVTGMSREERVDALGKATDQLSGMSQERVETLAARVEAAMGGSAAAERAFSPDPEATGPFDGHTSVLYDMRARTTDAGEEVIDWVLVDAAGRSHTVTYPAKDMTPATRASLRVFDMARENPKLRPLLESAIRLAETQFMDSTAKASEGEPAAASGEISEPAAQ